MTDARWDLSDLVADRLDVLQLSYRAAEAISADPLGKEDGLLWKRGTLENLAKRRGIKAPSAGQLRALAHITQMPLRAIQDKAAAQFFDMDTVTSEDGEARLMAQRFAELSPDDQERLRVIVESWGVKGAVPRAGDNS